MASKMIDFDVILLLLSPVHRYEFTFITRHKINLCLRIGKYTAIGKAFGCTEIYSAVFCSSHLLTHGILCGGYLVHINLLILNRWLKGLEDLGSNSLYISKWRENLNLRMGLCNYQVETSVTHCFPVCTFEFMGIPTLDLACQLFVVLWIDLQGVSCK